MRDFLTLGLASLVGFEAGSALYRQRKLRSSHMIVLPWALGFILLFMLWHSTGEVSLKGWWIGAGIILILKAFQDLQHHQSLNHTLQSTWIEPLEAVGTLFVLIVGTGRLDAVITGFIAGVVLPFAFQDWLRPWQGWTDILRTVSLGAVGLEDLAHGLWPASWQPWPYVWWMIPWLLWWEVSDWFWRDYATAWPPKQ